MYAPQSWGALGSTAEVKEVCAIYYGSVFRIGVTYNKADIVLPTTFILKMTFETLAASAEREMLAYGTLLEFMPLFDTLRMPRLSWTAQCGDLLCSCKVRCISPGTFCGINCDPG